MSGDLHVAQHDHVVAARNESRRMAPEPADYPVNPRQVVVNAPGDALELVPAFAGKRDCETGLAGGKDIETESPGPSDHGQQLGSAVQRH